MSPRRPAVLSEDSERNLRDHLIETAAALIAERGTAGLGVRDITRTAQVADGVLYNYFQDKEDLLAHALLVHVGAVMEDAAPMPVAGGGTLVENLRQFVINGVLVLIRIAPAFAGLVSQPKVLTRFREMIGGDAALGVATGEERAVEDRAVRGGLPDMLAAYLSAEQQLGRIAAEADATSAARVMVGAIHGQVLPPLLFNPPGEPIQVPPEFADQLVHTILNGIAPEAA